MYFRVLQHFGASIKDYSVIFTSNATLALKLLAETFQFNTSQSSRLSATNQITPKIICPKNLQELKHHFIGKKKFCIKDKIN